jgi:hypothetical protein
VSATPTPQAGDPAPEALCPKCKGFNAHLGSCENGNEFLARIYAQLAGGTYLPPAVSPSEPTPYLEQIGALDIQREVNRRMAKKLPPAPPPEAGDPLRALEALEKHFTLPQGDNDTRLQMLGYLATVKATISQPQEARECWVVVREGSMWGYETRDKWAEAWSSLESAQLVAKRESKIVVRMVEAPESAPLPEAKPKGSNSESSGPSVPRKEGE